MKLARPIRSARLVSLVPMIDVLLILLVFFMVTSTYLDLDMIPARSPEQTLETTSLSARSAPTVMIRIGADGAPFLRGTYHSRPMLLDELSRQIKDDPDTQILILPSGSAKTQALVGVLDVATEAGVSRLRVLQLDAQP